MKVGILGDIHGNKDALSAVLSSARDCGVERILITGDIVGYYPFVSEVLSLLNSWDMDVVRGNHEEMLARAMIDGGYLAEVTKKYGSGLKDSMDQLSQEQMDYLINLPHPLILTIDSVAIALSHGSPYNVNDYIYPDADLTICRWVEDLDCDIFICGHTHYPMKRVIGEKIVVNPGSVGQPRNQGSAAHWVLYDTDSHHFVFKKEEYNSDNVIEWAKSVNAQAPYLHEVFTR